MNPLFFPIALPFLTGALCLLLDRSPRAVLIVALGTCLALVGSGVDLIQRAAQGPLTFTPGNWPAPFGIEFALSRGNAVMITLTGFVSLLAIWHAAHFLPRNLKHGRMAALGLFLIAGVNGGYLTRDLFNLFVWNEVILISSVALIATSGTAKALQGAFKFLILNWVASFLLLIAAGLAYARYGTLNFVDLAQLQQANPGTAVVLSGLLVTVFLAKAAAFPIFGWLPASYGAVPTSVVAFLTGLGTKFGLFALAKVMEAGFTVPLAWIQAIAGLTMVVGVLGALAQVNVQRTLSWHIVSQMGYMILGVGLMTTFGVAGALLHLAHNAVVKMGLFFWCDHVAQRRGSVAFPKIQGVSRELPIAGAAFFFLVLALVGIPPLSGFISKYTLLAATVESGNPWLTAVPVFVSLLTMTCLFKVEILARTAPETADTEAEVADVRPERFSLQYGPILLCALFALVFGIMAGPIVDFLNPQTPNLILGGRP